MKPPESRPEERFLDPLPLALFHRGVGDKGWGVGGFGRLVWRHDISCCRVVNRACFALRRRLRAIVSEP